VLCTRCNRLVFASQMKVLAVAGYNRNDDCLRSCEMLDVESATWSHAPDMNVARYFAAAASCDGRAFVCGGWNGSILNSAEVLEDGATRWTLLTATMNTPRRSFGAAVLDGRVYLVGGETNDEDALWSVETLSTSTLQFEHNVVGTMSIGRRRHAVTCCNVPT
jgi:outer membrane protein assembly factor BamB